MIFNTDTAFNIEKKDVAFLSAGIHDDASFGGTRVEKSANGNLFIEFTFSKNGANVTHTEYEPTKFDDQTDEAFNDKINKQVARILHIMSPFYTKDQLKNFSATSFEAFINWVHALMSSADKSILVRLKVVYGQNGFTSLPRYARYTFIEPMSVAKENSKITELKIDSFEKPAMGDKEAEVKTSTEVFSTPVVVAPQVGADLPF